MNEFAYVDILESLASSGSFYVGLTADLAARLAKRNAGGVPHTAKDRPWRVKTAAAQTGEPAGDATHHRHRHNDAQG